jgi:hypothetical protein
MSNLMSSTELPIRKEFHWMSFGPITITAFRAKICLGENNHPHFPFDAFSAKKYAYFGDYTHIRNCPPILSK